MTYAEDSEICVRMRLHGETTYDELCETIIITEVEQNIEETSEDSKKDEQKEERNDKKEDNLTISATNLSNNMEKIIENQIAKPSKIILSKNNKDVKSSN